jgi:AcrR family transcriptional regulator
VSTPATRRSSYGPNSPRVGERGARTRQRLLEVALRRFADVGFHATGVEEIARDAGVSRATFYQYFDSREQLVRELIDECGAALIRLVGRLGTLGPTKQGYDNLHWWLGEWAYIYDKYATVFVEWARIDGPNTLLRPMVARFVESFVERLAPKLATAGVEGLDPDPTALLLVTVVERFNYYRVTQPVGVSDDVMLDTLAVSVQRYLFPATKRSAYLLFGDAPAVTARIAPPPNPIAATAEPRELSDAAQASVEQLLEAGGRVFAAHGYRQSSVEAILESAGLSRRTFYKYFGNRLDLLMAVSQRCAERVNNVNDLFAQQRTPAEVLGWAETAVGFVEGIGGALRIWLEEPVNDTMRATAETVLGGLTARWAAAFTALDTPPGFDPVAGAWLLLAVVERMPHQGVETRYDLNHAETIEAIAGFVGRAMLNL